jgi:protein-S-isoprenylcysteine O-methyltransferase Ste14
LDKVRYVFALLTVVSVPAAVVLWLIVHPFIGFWRRLGPSLAYIIMAVLSLASIALLVSLRGPILRIEFGTNYILIAIGALLYAVSVFVEIRTRKHLKWRTLVGLPELSPEKPGPGLLTEGIYSRIRHPRYLAVTIGMFAFALFTNYLAMYVLVLLIIPGLYWVVLLEERELRDRFGSEYVSYSERVPMFFPKLR